MNEKDFFSQLGTSDAGQKYLSIVQDSEVRDRPLVREKGYEIHHVWSKALGGGNGSENLVKLTIYEHVLAHYYLALAIDCRETVYPLIILSNRAIQSLSDLEKVSIEQLEHWSQLRQKANEMLLGRICINNGMVKKYVFKNDLQSYLDQGWTLGNLPTTAGRATINDGINDKKVKPEEIQGFLNQGWKMGSVRQGKPRSDAGRHVGFWKYMVNGDSEKRVPTEEQQRYLDQGWKYGRLPFSKETLKKMSAKAKTRDSFCGHTEESRRRRHETGLGRVWVTFEGQDRWVTVEESEILIQQGWERGRFKIKRKKLC